MKRDRAERKLGSYDRLGRPLAAVPGRPGPATSHLFAAGSGCQEGAMSVDLFPGPRRSGRRRLSARPLARHRGRPDRAALHSRPAYHGAVRRHRRSHPDAADLRGRRPARRPRSSNAQATRALRSAPCSTDAPQARRRAARHRSRSSAGQLCRRADAAARQAAAAMSTLGSSWTHAHSRRRPGARAARASPRPARAVGRNSAPAITFERVVKYRAAGLLGCVAVLTTIGIVFSVLFETIRFFQQGLADRLPVRHCSGRRRPRCAPTRSARRAPSASCRWSPARC